MTTAEVVTLVIGSGLLAALVSSIVALVSGKWERKHRTAERTAVEQHEARLRRELAHDQARDSYLPIAMQLAAFLNKGAAETHWNEVGTFFDLGTDQPMPTTRVEALDRLRQIMYGHPSQAVRAHARSLHDDIHTQWTEIDGNEIPEPTLSQQVDWFTRAETLIELIHTPEGATT